jgi:hypothetical protein
MPGRMAERLLRSARPTAAAGVSIDVTESKMTAGQFTS